MIERLRKREKVITNHSLTARLIALSLSWEKFCSYYFALIITHNVYNCRALWSIQYDTLTVIIISGVDTVTSRNL